MQIFVSYSSKNREAVRELAADLEALGHEVWWDRVLTGGQVWWDEILENVHECDLFVFVLTPDSIASYPCRLEYQYAHSLNKRILPVLLLDGVNIAQLPPELQVIQFVDYCQDSRQAFRDLGRALANLPTKRPLPDPLPQSPPTPISPLAKLRQEVEKVSLDVDQQAALVMEIRPYLTHPEMADEAQELLFKMKSQPYILHRIAQAIDQLIASLPPKPVVRLVDRPTRRRLASRSGESYVGPLIGHTAQVLSCDFSPDGRYVATAGRDGTARIWNAFTGDQVQHLVRGGNTINQVSYSPNGTYIVVGESEGMLLVYDATRREHLDTIPHKDGIGCFAFNSNGFEIAVGGYDGFIRLYSLRNMKLTNLIQRMRLNPNSLINWNYSIATPAHEGKVNCITYDLTDRYVASGGQDSVVRIWDSKDKFTKTITSVQLPFVGPDYENVQDAPINSITYSVDGRYIISALANNDISIYPIMKEDTLQPVDYSDSHFVNSPHDSPITCVRFSPNNNYLLAACFDGQVELLKVNLDENILEEIFAFSHPAAVNDISFSPNGRYVLTASDDHTAQIWDFAAMLKQ